MKNNGTDSQFPGRHFKHEMSARKQRKNTNHMTATSWQVRSLLAVLTRSFRQKVLRSLSLLVAEIIMVDFLLATNLTHFFRCIYLFPFSTCFEQPSAHHQENLILSTRHLVYITLCRWASGMQVCTIGLLETCRGGKYINTLKKVGQVGC